MKTNHSAVDTPLPFLALANHAALPPGRRFGPWRVRSRMLLWCRGGRGTVTVDGAEHEMRPGHYLILPWDHTIRYCAGKGAVWRLGGAHVIPHLSRTAPAVFEVSHVRPDAPPLLPGRADAPCPGLEGVRGGSFARARALESLAEYAVAWFVRGPEAAGARTLGGLLLAEMGRAAAEAGESAQGLPGALRRMTVEVERRLLGPLRVADLARAGRCSPATVTRLFRRWFGRAPLRWILERRLDRAAELLAETDLTIAEVGRRVGVPDPFYFSRLFRRLRGVTASAHRQRARML